MNPTVAVYLILSVVESGCVAVMASLGAMAACQLDASSKKITYEVTENMPVQLHCNVTLDVPGNQSYSVTWYQFKVNSFDKEPVARREGEQVTMFGDWLPRVSILPNGSLYFPMTNFQHDDAFYHCDVIAANGFNESVNMGLRIDRPMAAPLITRGKNTTTFVQEGQLANYTCNDNGGNISIGDTPLVKWVKLMRAMGTGDINCDTNHYQMNHCSSTISFRVTRDMDGYRMVCKALYGLAMESALRLHVGYRPHISLSIFPSNSVVVGSSVLFVCNIVSNPAPTIAWHGSRLPGRSRTYNRTMFTLENVASTDAGKYTCEAMNAFGKETETIAFKVTSAPTTTGSVTTPNPLLGEGRDIAVAGVVIASLCVVGFIITLLLILRRIKGTGVIDEMCKYDDSPVQ